MYAKKVATRLCGSGWLVGLNEISIVAADCSSGRMLRAQYSLANRQRTFIKRQCFGKPGFLPVKHSEVVQAQRCVGMFRAEHLFPNRDCPLDNRYSFLIAPKLLVKHGEVVETTCGIRMLRP